MKIIYKCEVGGVSSVFPSNAIKATPSSILAWGIPRTEEPGGLQSIGLQTVRHNRSDLARMQSERHSSTQRKAILRMGNTCIPVADSF